MTSIIYFTPISGALDESPPCYLLNIDEFCFLLDCGLDESCNVDYVENLKPHMSKIDAVLLSHPDTFHLGALPYLFGKCGLSCDVYATTPVYQMGQMFAYDLYQSRHSFEDFNLFSLDDVDLAFDKVIQVKYNQTVMLKGKGQGITLTPLPAGHMIGGTVWKIVKDGEEDILYAVDINHKKERHLNGCTIDKLSRPSMLIIDCDNINYLPERRKKRDTQLFSSIIETLRSSGNVLIGTDTAGRILELSHMLDQMWRSEPGLHVYSIILLNNFSYNVIEFAKSLVEWMSDKLMRGFEGQRNNPFAFKHIQLCHNLNELARIPEPYIVLASQPDFECGFSRELFYNLCGNAKNTIILTQRSSPGTLSDLLINSVNLPRPFTMKFERKIRVPLTGEELDEYLERKRNEELEKEKEKNASNSIKEKNNDDDDESDDESDDEDDEEYFDEEFNRIKNVKNENSRTVTNISGTQHNTAKHDLMMSSRMDGRLKGGGFFKNAKKSYPMFPCVEKKIKWDDYGEIINADDYSIFDMSKMFMEDKENMMISEELKNGGENMAKINDDTMNESTKETNPTKCIRNLEELQIKAKIELIDFEGRSDGESLKRIIKLIRPRRLVLVRGLTDKANSFASYCQNNDCVPGKIFTPKISELVDATTERHIYQIKLKDALVSSLKFSHYKDGAQLSWVEAEIDMDITESILPQDEDQQQTNSDSNEPNNNKKDELDSTLMIQIDHHRNNNREMIPILKQLPSSEMPTHQTIFVNELKLSDFKQILMKHDIQAEFSGGVLLCNGQVEVKRTESGRIHLEGTVSNEYFKIRQLLYDQYAIL
ncbi:cleavage and polyadenylation specificity factor subunit 2 [Dermatophagoides farinae]|uniref:Cleavage and polyadenylation specificity factor subunit 2 n=1 Tax=Dermatophagoides farinae TaxID=6954 RepID=A0A922L5D2_DERFA|nr:cleavage and polyadenylation specificity factor subunit 2 [Dermatophagoides farinae]